MKCVYNIAEILTAHGITAANSNKFVIVAS